MDNLEHRPHSDHAGGQYERDQKANDISPCSNFRETPIKCIFHFIEFVSVGFLQELLKSAVY